MVSAISAPMIDLPDPNTFADRLPVEGHIELGESPPGIFKMAVEVEHNGKLYRQGVASKTPAWEKLFARLVEWLNAELKRDG